MGNWHASIPMGRILPMYGMLRPYVKDKKRPIIIPLFYNHASLANPRRPLHYIVWVFVAQDRQVHQTAMAVPATDLRTFRIPRNPDLPGPAGLVGC